MSDVGSAPLFVGAAPFVGLGVAPDGTVCTVDVAGFVARWDPSREAPRSRVALEGRGAFVPVAAALLSDGRHAVVSLTSGAVALHDVDTGACRWRVGAVGRGRQVVPQVRVIEISPDGALVATLAEAEIEPAIRVWSTANGAEVGRIAGLATSVRFLPDGAHALVDGARVVSLASGNTVLEIPRLEKTERARVGACTPNGESIVTGDAQGRLARWEIAALRAGARDPMWRTEQRSAGGHPAPITRIDVSRDGARFFTTTPLGHQCWELRSGARRADATFAGAWRIARTSDETTVFGIALQRPQVWRLALGSSA